MAEVSVVLPTYNRADWLEEAVASVLRQTRPPAEVIIVDDGSTDDTAEVCRRFPEPVRYLRQENAGVAAARNRGIEAARGEWIALIDSDDVWEPQKLETQLAALARVPAARWCASDCLLIDMDGSPLPGRDAFERVFEAFDAVGLEPEAFFARWLARMELEVAGARHVFFHGDFFELLFHGNVVLPSSALVHRGVVENVGLFDSGLRFAEETEFFHRASVAHPGLMLMSPLVRYRVSREDSMTNPANTPLFVRGALVSLDGAVRLRGKLTASEREAYEGGRHRLLSKLAYAELSLLNRSAAREALQLSWRAGAERNPRSVALYAASLLPLAVLRGLHRVKRGLAAHAA